MPKEEIVKFITDKIKSGGSLSEAKDILLKQGFSEQDIEEAAEAYVLKSEEVSEEAKKLEEKIKEEPYDDETIKKRIRRTKIYAGVFIVVLVIILILISILRLLVGFKTMDFGMMRMTPLFYLVMGGGVLIFIISIITAVILLKNYKKLSTYNKTKFIIRALIYVLVIVIVGLFLFSDLFYGESLSDEYSSVKEFDEVFIPTIQEIDELNKENNKYVDEGVHEYYLSSLNHVISGNYEHSDEMIENLSKSRQLYRLSLNNTIKILNNTESLIDNKNLRKLTFNINKSFGPLRDITEMNIEFINLRLSMIDDLMMIIEANEKGDEEKKNKLSNEFNLKVEEEKAINQEIESYLSNLKK